MVDKNEVNSSLFGYPISFYIEKAELPWAVYALCLFILYFITFWFDLPYLTVLVPASFIGCVICVAVAVYFYGIKSSLPWGASLTLGIILGLLLGLVSSLLALIRFWYLWLFFNIITESIMSAVLGLVVALLVVLLFKIPWLKKYSGTIKINSEFYGRQS